MKFLAAVMTFIFCLSALCVTGGICLEDAAVLSGSDQDCHFSKATIDSFSSDESDLPFAQPVHLCHCGHSLQILIVSVSNEMFQKSVPAAEARWPRLVESAVSRDLSPLLRPPILA